MPLTLQLKKMSQADKLRAMEAIWSDLSKKETRFESPAWHGEALQETHRLVKVGQAKFSDWEEAKVRLRQKASKELPEPGPMETTPLDVLKRT